MGLSQRELPTSTACSPAELRPELALGEALLRGRGEVVEGLVGEFSQVPVTGAEFSRVVESNCEEAALGYGFGWHLSS